MNEDLSQYDRCKVCGHWQRDHDPEGSFCDHEACDCSGWVLGTLAERRPGWRERKMRELSNMAIAMEGQARQLKRIVESMRG